MYNLNEKKYKRIFTVVIDSLGAGEMSDAASYGDAGTDTLGHIAANVEEFKILNLQKLGIANLKDLAGVAPVEKTLAYYGKLREASNGKDTMTGHWEIMGINTEKPLKTYTEPGFPPDLFPEVSPEAPGSPAQGWVCHQNEYFLFFPVFLPFHLPLPFQEAGSHYGFFCISHSFCKLN